MRTAVWLAMCGVIVLLGFSMEQVHAEKAKGKTRAATIRQLMKGLVGAQLNDLKKSLEADKVDWQTISQQAALLNESGYLLLEDGRSPDNDWSNAAKALQSRSAELVDLAEKKDTAAAKALFKTLTTESCAACHAAHRI